MITLRIEFDEKKQNAPWRNKVAKQLNILLGRARYFKNTTDDASDREACRATLAIVARVAEFEEIQEIK